jgi:hypothetical protein
MIFKTDIHPWIQYLIVIILICFSGDQPFTGGARSEELLIAFFIFLLVLYFTRKKSPLAFSDLSVIFLFLMILAVQALSFSFFPLVTIAGFIMRLFIGFAAVRLVDNFPRIYINVMYVICIVSLCFYIPEQLFHAVGRDFASLFMPIVNLVGKVFLFLNAEDAHILIYNFERPKEVHRNAGIFWEPGAFAGYILLALIFLGLKKDSYEKRFYMSRFYMMLITLLTTLSTMGYLVCSVVLMIHYRLGSRTVAANLGWLFIIVMTFPLLVYGAIRIWNLDFMGQKINHQYQQAAPRAEYSQMNRIGSLLLDLEYIKRRPFFGWGINPKTHFALDPRDMFITKGRGNGFTGFIHAFGLLGFWGFIAAAWKGLYILSGNNFFRSFLAVAAILLMLNGEAYLNFPLFLGLMFLQKSRWKSAEENGMNTRDHHERAASIGFTVA